VRGGGGGAGVTGASLNTRRSERSRPSEMKWWTSRGTCIQLRLNGEMSLCCQNLPHGEHEAITYMLRNYKMVTLLLPHDSKMQLVCRPVLSEKLLVDTYGYQVVVTWDYCMALVWLPLV